jgi:hypothetical protein
MKEFPFFSIMIPVLKYPETFEILENLYLSRSINAIDYSSWRIKTLEGQAISK